ncbi:MAG: hypothetical protein WC509_08280 [Candidatus Izemoplasmatales bacterium]
MIEIGEALALARQMDEAISGKTVADAAFLSAPHRFCWIGMDPAAAADRLRGRTVERVQAVGGRVVVRCSGGQNVAIGEDVTVRYCDPRLEKTQMLLSFADGTNLTARVKLYGYLSVGGEDELRANPYYVAHADGIAPLSPDFTVERFARTATENPRLSVKALLATGQRIPGVGNGTIQDVLWTARLRPETRVSALREEEILRLYEALVGTTRAIAAAGGRASFVDLHGNHGLYAERTRRPDGRCPACGTTIVEKAFLGGKVRYCPACQEDRR